MDKSVIPKIIWQVRQGSTRLGLPGIVGLGIFAFGLAFYVSAIYPAQGRLEALRRDAESLGQLARAAAGEQKSGPVEQLSAFYEFFPKSASSPDWLAKLYEAAAAQNLNLEQGEYRMVRDRTGRLLRYEINLPVKGGYLQIRKFLSQLLADIPNASLDSVTFQRQKISDAAIESQIKLTLYLGAS